MIRIALVFLAVLAVVVLAVALNGDPGQASVTWLGWRMDTSGSAAAILIGFLALFAVIFWRLVLWIAEAPRRAAKARAEGRRRQAAEVLTRGFLAVAAGEGPEARRCAQKAAELAEDSPSLVRILAAQSAEAAGDLAAAQGAYSAMLGFPEMRLVAYRGLMTTAVAQGDKPAALKHAEAAYALSKTARWAWRALFDAALEAGEWPKALDLVDGGQKRKILTPAVAERARAALLAASAAGLESAADAKLREQAEGAAVRAAKLSPAFAPGAVMAARLLGAAGKLPKAQDVIEQAWEAAPHPALWLAYRDLKTNETPAERAARLNTLIARNPDHREGRILAVEQALLSGDNAALEAAVARLGDEAPTQRLCGLFSRAAWAMGRPDEARGWAARGSAAPQEPDWSDLDPEGRAFNYAPSDWSRLVAAWADTGELLHPRFERRERTLNDLPELPASYAASAPFVSPADEGQAFTAPLPDDPGDFDDMLAGPAPEPAPAPPTPPRRRAPRRRASNIGKPAGNA